MHTRSAQNSTILLLLLLSCFTTLRAQLVLNEVLADPISGFGGDANGDGLRDPSDDVFVEFVNSGSTAINISGYTIHDATSERHVFPAGTILNPGQAVVVFGGGMPTGYFGGAVVQVASSGSLSLSNSGDVILLKNASGLTLISFTYGPEGNMNQSLCRDPDIIGPGPMTLHSLATSSSSALYSPGTRNDGFAFQSPTTTLLRFFNKALYTSEDSATVLLQVKLINASAVLPTTADIIYAGGTASSPDIGGYAGSSISFPAGTEGLQTVVISITDDAIAENVESLQFGLTNVSGGILASAIELDTTVLTIFDNDLTTAVIINEIHADPAPGLAGDANADGVRDPSEDEFIELVNSGPVALDLSGYQLNDGSQLRHTITPGTIINAGSGLVVFGGGTPVGSFAGSDVQIAGSGGLGLTNSGDKVILKNPEGNPLIIYEYDSLAANDQSLTRSPDITGSDMPMTLHSVAPGSAGQLYSPGGRVDGSAFVAGLPTQLQFTITGSDISESNGTYGLSVSITNPSDIQSTSVDVLLVGGDAADIDGFSFGSLTFPVGSPTPQILNLTITDDALIEASDTILLKLQNAIGGTAVSIGGQDTFSLVIFDNELSFPLVLNEIHADPADGSAGDANGDGNRDFSEDEFIEWFNNSSLAADVSGYQVFDGSQVRHTFPPGSIVPSSGAMVLFGGGSPTGSFGGATVQTASNGKLSLQNLGDQIRIENSAGITVFYYTYGPEGDNNQSLNRSPDVTGPDTSFSLHSTIAGAGGALYSPGLLSNGTIFSGSCNSAIAPSGLSSVVGSSTVVVNWQPMPFSVGCQLKIGPLAGPKKNVTVAGPEQHTKVIPMSVLSPQTYVWQVRCACSIPPAVLDASAFSASDSFVVLVPKTINPFDEIFPNPVKDVLYVRTNYPSKVKVDIQVHDLQGKLVYNKHITSTSESEQINIDMGHLASGMYVLSLRTPTTTKSSLIVKE